MNSSDSSVYMDSIELIFKNIILENKLNILNNLENFKKWIYLIKFINFEKGDAGTK
jgi:hypothetical protein